MSPGRPPRPRELSEFLYETVDVNATIATNAWAPFYDSIPVDPYVAEGYRYKAIAWLRVRHRLGAVNAAIDGHIARANASSGMSAARSRGFQSDAAPSWTSDESGYLCWQLPQYSLAQSKSYNPVHGDLRREYPPLEPRLLGGPDLRRLVVDYASRFQWDDAIVLVQFQRVDCVPRRGGRAAIEGFHQDGNPHVAMLVVDRVNITNDSGVSQYKMDSGGKMTDEVVFDAVIPPGHVIYWNDRRVWHYGTDLEIADAGANGGRGFRDVVILSAKGTPRSRAHGARTRSIPRLVRRRSRRFPTSRAPRPTSGAEPVAPICFTPCSHGVDHAREGEQRSAAPLLLRRRARSARLRLPEVRQPAHAPGRGAASRPGVSVQVDPRRSGQLPR